MQNIVVIITMLVTHTYLSARVCSEHLRSSIQALSRLSFSVFLYTSFCFNLAYISNIDYCQMVSQFFNFNWTILLKNIECVELQLKSSQCHYIIIISFIFPGSVIVIVYGIILHRIRQLTRRIVPDIISIQCSLSSVQRNL
jgi:hypothetical protein